MPVKYDINALESFAAPVAAGSGDELRLAAAATCIECSLEAHDPMPSAAANSCGWIYSCSIARCNIDGMNNNV